MLQTSVGFIGSGRVAKILLTGWARAKFMPKQVVLFDPKPEACEALKPLGSEIQVAPGVELAAAQDIVFLAVHPPAIAEAAAAIKPSLRAGGLLVSLSPKFTIAKLTALLDGFDRIARVIPNAPSIVGRGFNPVAFGATLTAHDRSVLGALLKNLGDSPEVNEQHLEAYAILSGMGPTYFWPQLYELVALGETFGIGREQAIEAIDKMLWGSVATMRDAGISPEQVQDLIPVKPVSDDVAALVSAYHAKLAGLMEKIKP
ncbi:MAG: pyrroline-5-carboxylate reductase [Candidatus Hydrogenedentota bacterium]